MTAVLLLLLGCGNPEPVARAPKSAPRVVATPTTAPTPASPRPCAPGDRDRAGEWRYALVGGPFEPIQDVTTAQLVEKWRAGAIAASAETERRLAPALGQRTTHLAAPAPDGWAIVAAHELAPAQSVITVDGNHPLTSLDGPLVVAMCGDRPVHNIDPARLTTLVMSGTTALTGRTAERIDDNGIADTIKHIKPFFTSADLVHVSNEVSFVKGCKPLTGQDRSELKFCSRDSYIDLLAELNTRLVELTGSHLTDYGERSLARTIAMYEQRGWVWFGGGRTQIEATAPRIVEHHGNKLAFVGCNAVNSWVRRLSTGLGTASCDWPRMRWQIQDLRRRGYLPIASVQHRELRTHAPPPDLVGDLRGLAEAGAVFVMGSQAHVAHPWDVHYGAYVHYGPGNILFAQYRVMQKDATVDKLYIYDGKLLTVGHLFVHTEHGQPRLQRDDERAAFLAELATAAAEIEPPQPVATPAVPPPTRARPDSLIVRGRNQYLDVVAPDHVDPEARYPLIVDLDGTLPPRDDAFYVKPIGAPKHTAQATADQIAAFMRAKYPVDTSQLSVSPATKKPRRHHHHHHHHHANADR